MFVELMPLLAGRTVLITVAKVDDPASRDCALTSLTCDCCLRMRRDVDLRCTMTPVKISRFRLEFLQRGEEMRNLTFLTRWVAWAVFGVLLVVASADAGVRYDSSSQVWTLTSGGTEYRLRQKEGTVYLDYFGPAGGAAWKGLPREEDPRYEIDGSVEGQGLSPENLTLLSQEISHPQGSVEELHLVFKHRRLALEIEVRYST